ncbi:MAG: RNA polymerase sigma-70 factor, ECF subfamily [Candidatus Magasanikbacteria bacterium GW2011_GWC2_37_14]|uniref:RNA polymerase sigma-70 factor, ECF subfamily n=1 Tax=Candidatus Magasanikbacteria bacterium GW2011_GWC2_37_14 TaxID=1619046 RepID=A0A0G0G9T4_9BACT|nr:MAG: RNA polymerase sigma-70 factor, ECF subfamily [Candidatus Magasanikbacteria bacterium GW2011_GWC2_37_14]
MVVLKMKYLWLNYCIIGMNKTNLFDEELIDLIRSTNQELYSEIIQRYQAKLSHYLYKFIGSQDELNDVLQEVFIKAFRNLYDFDTTKKFSSWLYRIAHNEAINHLKKYHREVMSLDEGEWEVVDSKINYGEKIDSQILREKIGKYLLQIKEKYRTPLVLYFFEEKSYEEISDILRVPVSTVGVLIMRGKKMLKNLINN